MKRGDIYFVSEREDYLRKLRPAVILQSHIFNYLSSVTICPLTSSSKGLRPFRPLIERSAGNGLDASSSIMVDKITTVRKERLRQWIGELNDEDLARLERAVTVFLGLES